MLRLVRGAVRSRRSPAAGAFLLATLAIAVSAAVPGYAEASARTIVFGEVAAAGADERSVAASRPAPVTSAGVDATADGAASAVRLPGVRAVLGLEVPGTVTGAAETDDAAWTTARLVARDGVCDHALIDGACPTGVDEVLLSTGTAVALGVAPGGAVTVRSPELNGDRRLRVSGTFRPRDPDSVYWAGRRYLTAGSSGAAPLFVAPAALAALRPQGAVQTVDLLIPDDLFLRRSPAEVRREVGAALARLSIAGYEATTAVPALADRVARSQSLFRLGVGTGAGQLLLFCWFLLFLTLRASATEQRPETGWLALRGVPRRHASMYRTAPVVLALAALGLAALATCAGAIAAAAADRQGRAGGVGALMRRVPGRDNAQWVAAGELVAAVCAIAGVVLLRTGADNATGVALLTPALVALATGLIAARALVPVAAAVGRRLLARGRVGHGLALLSLGRRPGVHRAIVLVTVGIAMLGSAIGAWTLAAAARAERADRTLGAARVLTVDARGVSHLLSATRGADPDGRYAMAAVQTYGAPPVLAVDARALPAVARWRPEFGSPTPDEAVRRLRPDYTAPLTGAGSRLRLDLDADRVGDNAFVRVRLAPVDGPTVLARLGPLAPGRASYVTTVDGCATRCRLMALELVSQPADETQVRLHRLDLDDRPLVTPTRFGVAGAWRADLTDVPDETRRFSVHHGPGVEQNYLQIQLSADRRAAFLAVYAADAPVPLPVFRAAGSGVPEQALTLFDAWIPVQVAGTAGQLPRLGGVGLLADLEYVSRLARSPTGAGVLQVWLTGDAPSGVLDRLRAAGVTIVADTGRGALLERYARQGPALALRLYLLAGLLGAGFAAVGLLVVSGVDRGQRAAELAALRRQGLGTATVKAIRAGVYGVPVAVGVLAGILAAVAGTSLTRSILHWFPDQPASALPAVQVVPAREVSALAGTSLAGTSPTGTSPVVGARTRLVFRDGFCDHVLPVSGRCPDGPMQVMVSEQTADRLALRIGAPVTVQAVQAMLAGGPAEPEPAGPPVDLALVGIYRPRDAASPYWAQHGYFAAPPGATPAFLVTAC